MTVVMLAAAVWASGQIHPAIYALSFWHYYLYWLAYRYRSVSLSVLKRDAILMKTVSLTALAFVYFGTPINLLSVMVVSLGFLLNIAAARVLGPDRTYYGHEVAQLPRKHITTFPYSWTSHPMLVGNILAFGGTLINTDFARDWWPLASVHVTLNVCLLLMELYVKPWIRGMKSTHQVLSSPLMLMIGTSAGWLLFAIFGLSNPAAYQTMNVLLNAGLGLTLTTHAITVFFCYSSVSLTRTPSHGNQGSKP